MSKGSPRASPKSRLSTGLKYLMFFCIVLAIWLLREPASPPIQIAMGPSPISGIRTNSHSFGSELEQNDEPAEAEARNSIAEISPKDLEIEIAGTVFLERPCAAC